jgi:hypothetical protein
MLRSQLKANFENDLRAAQKLRLPWWGVWCVVLPALPFFIFLNSRGRLDLALPILASVATIALVIILKRRCAKRAWFWGLIVLFSALHLALIWLVPWPTKWVFPLLSAGVASADFCVLLVIISFAELLMGTQGQEGDGGALQ